MQVHKIDEVISGPVNRMAEDMIRLYPTYLVVSISLSLSLQLFLNHICDEVLTRRF